MILSPVINRKQEALDFLSYRLKNPSGWFEDELAHNFMEWAMCLQFQTANNISDAYYFIPISLSFHGSNVPVTRTGSIKEQPCGCSKFLWRSRWSLRWTPGLRQAQTRRIGVRRELLQSTMQQWNTYWEYILLTIWLLNLMQISSSSLSRRTILRGSMLIYFGPWPCVAIKCTAKDSIATFGRDPIFHPPELVLVLGLKQDCMRTSVQDRAPHKIL